MSKVWFITGAGRGMGTDIAKAALAAGYKVVATGIVVLMNTQGAAFYSAFAALSKLTPVVAKSLERSQAKALKEALPSWQKYTGRYVLTDPNAIRTVTFSGFDVSLVNQKLVLTAPNYGPVQ